MTQAREAQLNIRSRFARERVRELIQRTGMTATQIVEEALRAYAPPPPGGSGRLVRKGPLLVFSGGSGVITLDETNAAIEAVRNERG